MQSESKPVVTFLGTSAAEASAYRGVSGILVESQGNYLLVDAGCGTFSQLVRLFGIEHTRHILSRLKCVWISHKHADHSQGIIQFFIELAKIAPGKTQSTENQFSKNPRKFFCDKCNAQFDFESSYELHYPVHHDDYLEESLRLPDNVSSPSLQIPSIEEDLEALLIIGPMWIESLLRDYKDLVEPISYNFVVGRELSLLDNPLVPWFRHWFGFSSIISIRMDHSYPTYGFVICGEDWKLVYSADSRPWPALIEAGKDATLLIHECTFDDHDAGRAHTTSHSTLSDSMQVTSDMNAKFVVLTHFSTRFERGSSPDISDQYFATKPELEHVKDRVLLGFDFLQLIVDTDFLTSSQPKFKALCSKLLD